MDSLVAGILLPAIGLLVLWFVIYSAVRSANRDLVRELLDAERSGRSDTPPTS